MSKTDPHYMDRCREAVRRGAVTGTEYRRGAIVEGWPRKTWLTPRPENRPPRGVIRSQTARSLIRASFAVSNAETDWAAMATLTFRERHPDPKECLRAWMRACWPDGASRWGVMWWQEYQRRGIVHYHLLLDELALRGALWGDFPIWRSVGKGRAARTVLGGTQGDVMALRWLEATGDMSDEAMRFNLGGIVERLADPEQAARYVASYVKKLAQKTLPDGECPQGRWWWMSPLVEPVARSRGVLSSWPLDRPHRMVFDKQALRKGGDEDGQSNHRGNREYLGKSGGGSGIPTGGEADPEAGERGKPGIDRSGPQVVYRLKGTRSGSVPQ